MTASARHHWSTLRRLSLAALLVFSLAACDGDEPSVDPSRLLREYGTVGIRRDNDLFLVFDTATATTLKGQWVIQFSVTRVSDEGRFVGQLSGNVLSLDLNPADNCTFGYYFTAAVSEDGTSLRGRVFPQPGTPPLSFSDTVTAIARDVELFPGPLRPCP